MLLREGRQRAERDGRFKRVNTLTPQSLAIYGETILPRSKAEKQVSLPNWANWPALYVRRHFVGLTF
jgi:hypothetical protein